jgi:hypothetical protein
MPVPVLPNPLCPFAIQWVLYPEANDRRELYPTCSVAHTAVSSAHGDELGRYFDREDINVESHFYIDEQGLIWQFMPVNRQAWAQFDGNSYCVSYETWDDADPENTPWNPAQLASITRLLLWLNTEWGIPTSIATLSPSGKQHIGAGYHSLFPSWNRERHSCPGTPRIAQFHSSVLPSLLGDFVLDEQTVTQLNAILHGHLGKSIPTVQYEEGSIQYIIRNRNYLDGIQDAAIANFKADLAGVLTSLVIPSSAAGEDASDVADAVVDAIVARLGATPTHG